MCLILIKIKYIMDFDNKLIVIFAMIKLIYVNYFSGEEHAKDSR